MAAEVLDRLGRDNVAFVLISMRDEADSGEYHSNSQQIFDELAGMHAKTVQRCMLKSEDFYTYESIFCEP